MTPSSKQKLIGYLAKKKGDNFEKIFQNHLNYHKICFYKIQDGCKSFKDKFGVLHNVKTKNFVDFVICKNGCIAFLDTKTTKAKSYPLSYIFGLKSSYNQFLTLKKFYESGFKNSGFYIDFYTLQKELFVPIGFLIDHEHKKSFSLSPKNTPELLINDFKKDFLDKIFN